MGSCCSSCFGRRRRSEEKEPLLPRYNSDDLLPPPSQLDKFAEIVAALSAGKLPTTTQFTHALRNLLNSDVLKVEVSGARGYGALSEGSEAVIEDVREIVEAVIQLGMEKNDDDKLQDLYYQTSHVPTKPVKLDTDVSVTVDKDFDRTPADLLSSAKVPKDELEADTQKVLSSLRTLVSLLFTSTAFRAILFDVLLTSREVLADVASDVSKVAAVVETKAEQVEEMVRPDEVEKAGDANVPDLDNIKGKAAEIVDDLKEKEAVTEKEARLKQEIAWKRINEESPDRVKDAVLERIKPIVNQAKANPAYQDALATLFGLISKYVEKAGLTVAAASSVVDQATEVAGSTSVDVNPSIHTDPHLDRAFSDIRVLLERFASGHSLDPLGNSIAKFAKRLGEEAEGEGEVLKDYFADVKDWIDKALREPSWADTYAAQRQSEKLYDRGKELLDVHPEWTDDIRDVLDRADEFLDALKKDKTTQRLIRALDRFAGDARRLGWLGVEVAAGQKDRLKAKRRELWRDAVGWILPRALLALRALPMPRLELKSDLIDLVVDHLIFSSASFLPDHIQIVNSNDVRYSADGPSRIDSMTRIHIDGLRLSARLISYFYHVKSSFFGWEDSGLLNVEIGEQSISGEGLQVDIELRLDDPESNPDVDPASFYTVSDVKVDIPGLAFQIHRSRHWIINTLLQPFLAPTVRWQLGPLLSTKIKEGLEQLNERAAEIRRRAIMLSGQDRAWDRSASVPLSAYWEAVLASTPAPEEVEELESPTTHTETHATLKGVVRTTETEESETVMAIGLGEQILPGVGGPDPSEDARRELVEGGRKAVGEVQETAEQAAREVRDTADDIAETGAKLKDGVGRAVDKGETKKRAEGKSGGWKSNAFDL